MKILKYIVILIVLILVAGGIYVATYDGSYDVSRSKIIKAPIAHTFNTVNDLKTWEQWGPWHDEDSTIVVTYGDKTVGVGASDSWTSKDGPGKMETIAVEPNKSIKQHIWFVDLEGEPGGVYWNFEEVAEGTKVTWGMNAKKSTFMFKMFAAMMGGWDAMLGPMEEKGLGNLEEVVLSTMPKFSLSTIDEGEVEEQTFIGYHHSMKINHAEMTKAFQQALPKAGMHAANSGLKFGEYTPGAVFTKYDEKTQETEFFVGLLLHKKLDLAEGMQELKLPKGKTVSIAKFGAYGTGDAQAHMKIDEYLKANNLTQNGPIWELYVNDPSMVKPEEIQTDIYYPVK